MPLTWFLNSAKTSLNEVAEDKERIDEHERLLAPLLLWAINFRTCTRTHNWLVVSCFSQAKLFKSEHRKGANEFTSKVNVTVILILVHAVESACSLGP